MQAKPKRNHIAFALALAERPISLHPQGHTKTPNLKYPLTMPSSMVAIKSEPTPSRPGHAPKYNVSKATPAASNGEQITKVYTQSALGHTNVYAAGQLIVTYANDTKGVHFHLNDWLGTRRMTLAYNGHDGDSPSNLRRK